MESPKSEAGKPVAAGKTPSKIPHVPKTMKPMSFKINKSAPSQSKIPKRDVGSSSVMASKPVSKIKAVDSKKSSKSLVSLRTPKSPGSLSLDHSISKSISSKPKRLMKSTDVTPRSQTSSTQSTDRSHKASDRVAARQNVLAFMNMKERVRSCQTEFMRRWEAVKNDLPHDEVGEYKLIGLIKDNEGRLLTKNGKIKINAGQKGLQDFKKDMESFVQNNVTLIVDFLDQLKTASSGKIGDTPGKGLDTLNHLEDMKKKIKAENTNALADMLKYVESFEVSGGKTNDHTVDPNLEAKVTKLVKEVDECRKNLDQSEKELSRIKKDEECKEASYKKQLEETDRRLSTKQHELDELRKQLESLEKGVSKEKLNYQELQEKLHSKSKEVQDLEKRLKISSQANNVQEYEARIKKLEAELKVCNEKRTQAEKHFADQTAKLTAEIDALAGDLARTKGEKDCLHEEIQCLKRDAAKHSETESELGLFRDKMKHAEGEIQNLQEKIKDLENKLQLSQSESGDSRTLQDEICRLQKVDADKGQKIEVLERELTRAHCQNQKLEEKILMDRKLLSVRTALIESLQATESVQKIRLEELFAEIDDSNRFIQPWKTELLTKTEEFQSLFSTLGSKQLELTRQEHIIKLLKESNERVQRLRVKQEAKIAQLEEEVAQLKDTIAAYEDGVLFNSSIKNNFLIKEVSSDSDLDDNLRFYVDGNHRKRHIDINVQKYEM